MKLPWPAKRLSGRYTEEQAAGFLFALPCGGLRFSETMSENDCLAVVLSVFDAFG